MDRVQGTFGLLILAQVAHSVEEYFGRLWESFPPARFLTGLISGDLESGFLVINVGLVAFGVWCWAVPVLRRWRSSAAIITGWAVIETINGIGHPLWSLRQGGYTPGAGTAPLLLLLSLVLFTMLRRERASTGAR